VREITELVVLRATKYGRRSGVILVSDGFFSALHQMEELRGEIKALRKTKRVRSEGDILPSLSGASSELFVEVFLMSQKVRLSREEFFCP
jgi:hypothetical protein